MRAPALSFLGLLLVAGCENRSSYALSGQYYDEENDCLGEDLVVDVIDGEAEGTCDGVRCIRSLETGEHYVTANCEVPEFYEDLTEAEEGPCFLALAAYERGEDGLCE